MSHDTNVSCLESHLHLISMTKEKRSRRSVAGIDQDELVDPSKLADADSSFLDFKGVQIHHKLYEHHEDPAALNHTPSVPGDHHQANRVGFPIVLLHGFGASLFSWERSMRPLARTTSSKVVAFDRPAFGLTSRLMVVTDKDIHSLNPYSSAFSALATLSFVDLLAEDKAILMGCVFLTFLLLLLNFFVHYFEGQKAFF